MAGWIDAHCHLAFADDGEIDAVVARARAAGVAGWVQGGTEPADWARQLQLRAHYGGAVATAFGLHPWWVGRMDDAAVSAALAALERALAGADGEAPDFLGEAGLDAAPRHKGSLERQRAAFRRQVAMARAAGKPLVLHVVRAHGEALAVLREAGPLPAGGLVHAFTGSGEVARSYVDLGLCVSVSGAVARPGFRRLKEAVHEVPRDALLVETDAPDGAREPAELPQVAAALARALGDGVTADELLTASAARLRRMLGRVGREG